MSLDNNGQLRCRENKREPQSLLTVLNDTVHITVSQLIKLTDSRCILFRPLRLSLKLVPATAWFANLRNICEQQTWDVIRKRTYKAYDYRCGICGGIGDKHPVECHEVWAYDDIDVRQEATYPVFC